MDDEVARVPSQTLMPGLRFESGTPWRIHMQSIQVLLDALGTDLTNAFVRCFGAVERLVSIVDIMNMNFENAGRDTVRGERNLHTLGMFAAGLVYELREGVRHLGEAGVEGRLTSEGLERWRMLETFATLSNADTLSQIRNCMAFHLGDPAIVQRGIERLARPEKREDGTEESPRELVLCRGDGPKQFECSWDFAGNVILAGIRVRPPGVTPGTPNSRRWVDEADMKAALTEARDNHLRVARLVAEVFLDLMRRSGANLDPLGPMAQRASHSDE